MHFDNFKNKFSIIIITILLLTTTALIYISDVVEADDSYSYSKEMKSFIKNGKNLRLLLAEHKNSFNITPCQNINAVISGTEKVVNLKNDKDYEIRYNTIDDVWWRLQVFASHDKTKVEEVITELEDAGYKNIHLIKEDVFYKVQLGDFSERKASEKLAKRLNDEGWNSWLTSYEKESNQRKIGIYGPDGELLLSGRNFTLSGEMRVNGSLYKGDFEFNYTNFGIELFNEISLNDLIAGILSYEIKGRARLSHYKYFDALKAQAIVIRTKILHDIFAEDNNFYKIKEFNDLSRITGYVKKAVTSTNGKVITHNGDLINSYYHKNSGGKTASSLYILDKEIPYLKSVFDPGAIEDPLFLPRWSYSLKEEKLLKRFSYQFDDKINGLRDIEVVKESPSGRAVSLRLSTDYGSYTLNGKEIQDFLQVDSLKFGLKKEFESGYIKKITIKGIGMGSGLGLSQDGAQIMARKGKNFKEIINYYYNNVSVLDLTRKGYLNELVNANVVSGLNYKEYRQLTWAGQKVITVLEYNPDSNRLIFDSFLANNKISGLADLSELAKEKYALAAINGGFYSYTGRPLGLFISSGKIVSEQIYERTTLAQTADGNFIINQVNWQGELKKSNGNNILKIEVANRRPNEGQIGIYNQYYGKKAPLLKSDMSQLVVKDGEVISILDTITILGTEIPENGFILQAKGKNPFSEFKKGDKVKYNDTFNKHEWNESQIVNAIGGGPLLLKDGQVNITGKEEKFQNDILYGRAPRTAVGIKENNNLVFITVDGRQPELSIGITLEELAYFMKDYGIIKGMNLDGGASARMVVRGFTMNNPSQERLISNGIIFLKNH